MLIKTEIGKNIIKFSWDEKIKVLRGNTLWLKYDVDVSQTPRHLANLMFGLMIADSLSRNSSTMVFDELTSKGLDCIQKFLRIYYNSKGMEGVERGYTPFFPPKFSVKVLAEKIVDPEQRDCDGPVLCSNGLGKDGLTTACMVKELGFDMRCFFVEGQMSAKVMDDRIEVMNRFYKLKSIKSNIIKTNFFDIKSRGIGFYSQLYAIPLAHSYNSEAILCSNNIHINKVHTKTMLLGSPGHTVFLDDYATKASGIFFSSPHSPVSLFGVETILIQRYGDVLELQRSCMKGSPWCSRCSKCYRHHLYISTNGVDPASIGLNPPPLDDINLLNPIPATCSSTVENVWKKVRGEPYKTWIEGASDPAIDLLWRGKEFKRIFQDHLNIYEEDVGDDGGGWMIQPSKWKGWIEKEVFL